MRIGLLTTSFPRHAEDVPGSFVLGFARALAARGHALEVLAPEPADAGAPPHFAAIDVRWVPYLRPRALARTFYGAGVLDNLAHAPWTALGLGPFVLALWAEARRRSARWDAVVSHWALPCALVAEQLGRRLPHLAVLHSADVFVLERLPLRAALAARIARAQNLLFVSRDLRARFLALLPALARAEAGAHAHVCAMGIEGTKGRAEPTERAALRRQLGVEGPCVLSMGRLIALKGIEHAIDAVVRTRDMQLVIAGAGPLRAALEQRARPHGARVRFVGELSGEPKRAWLRAADLFVLPSTRGAGGRTEGMPSVLLEAMETGLPVVASDVGGVSDVVRAGENGLLVPAADPDALARAFSALADDDLRARLSEGARACAALYHWDVLGPHLEALLFAADAGEASC